MFCILPQSNRKAAQRRRINKGEVYRLKNKVFNSINSRVLEYLDKYY